MNLDLETRILIAAIVILVLAMMQGCGDELDDEPIASDAAPVDNGARDAGPPPPCVDDFYPAAGAERPFSWIIEIGPDRWLTYPADGGMACTLPQGELDHCRQQRRCCGEEGQRVLARCATEVQP